MCAFLHAFLVPCRNLQRSPPAKRSSVSSSPFKQHCKRWAAVESLHLWHMQASQCSCYPFNPLASHTKLSLEFGRIVALILQHRCHCAYAPSAILRTAPTPLSITVLSRSDSLPDGLRSRACADKLQYKSPFATHHRPLRRCQQTHPWQALPTYSADAWRSTPAEGGPGSKTSVLV